MNPERAATAAARWFPRSLLILAVGACAIAWGTPHYPTLLSWAVPVVLVALTLMAAAPARVTLPGRVSPAGAASFALTFNAAALLLLVPVIVLVSKNAGEKVPGWTYPFLDKRWLIALYGVALVVVFVMPALFHQLFPHEPVADRPAGDRPRKLLAGIAGIMVVTALALLVAGPPWHVERHHRGIDFHEQVHLGPLQAIDKGRMPFIGPAATQYGPGSQLLTYAYMKGSGRFTIVGFREANLLFHFVTLLATGLVALWLIDLPAALLVMIIGLAFSPLSFFSAAPDGTMQGSYGWGNTLRYLGALLVVPGAVIAATRVNARRVSLPHIIFGLVWGCFAWVSQENLTSTAAAGGLSLLLLLLTCTIRIRQAVIVTASLAIGFGMFWGPLLGVYAASGHAGDFLSNYFRVASAVAIGFSNAWWTEDTTSPVYTAYRFTPFVVIAVGLLTLWDLRTLHLRTGLAARQVRLLAFVSLLAATYLTTLYRSDSSHLVNTLLPLPFVLTLAFRDLPSWTAGSRIGRALVHAVVAAAAFYVYPIAPMLTDLPAALIKPSLIRFAAPVAAAPAVVPGSGVAFERATPQLSDEPVVVTGSVPMRQFLEEASEIHRVVGDRTTFLTAISSVYTGLVYFMADLTPDAALIERETMIINSLISQDVLSQYRRRAPEIDCVIVSALEMDEAKIFLAAHPGARVERRPLAGQPVFVLLAN